MLTNRSESDGLSGDVCFGFVGMCEREGGECAVVLSLCVIGLSSVSPAQDSQTSPY